MCSLLTEPSPDGLRLGDFTFVHRGAWNFKIWQKIHWYILFHILIWRSLELCLVGLSPPSHRGNGTSGQQTSISKTVLPNHARWDISLFNTQQWLQRPTYDGNCVEQLYAVQLYNCFAQHPFQQKPSAKSYLKISFTLALCFQTKVIASNWEKHLFKFFLFKWIFLRLQMFSIPSNNGDLRNSHCLSTGSDSLQATWSSNRQSELRVTHANTPASLLRFKNVIFRHHYVMQKNSSYTDAESEQRSLCIVLHFNRQNLILISPLHHQAAAICTYWQYPTEHQE